MPLRYQMTPLRCRDDQSTRLVLGTAVGPASTVWAFEPNRERYECAQVTIALNQLENVVLNHAGSHQESATALLATSDAKGRPLGGASHLVSDLTSGVSSEEVNLLAMTPTRSSAAGCRASRERAF